MGKYGGTPSLGVCRNCPDNTAAPIWPIITRSPPSQPAAELERDEGRLLVCESCAHAATVTRWQGRYRIYGVKCDACGCGLRRVTDGCPLGRF
jgi:hypothetical protein